MKRIFALVHLLLFFAVSHHLHAQSDPEPCGTDRLWQQLQAQDPKMAARQRVLDAQVAFIASQPDAQRVGTLYTIPVVVHIVHNGGPENITNLMVQQGIAHINAALANTGAYDSLNGVDTEIELCLASQDPTGAGTSGIVRVQNTLTNLTMETQDLSLKNLSRWDPTRYLNVWLVAEINSNSSGPGVAGYAFLPSAHGTVQDGIVCESRWFGSTTDNSKIMVHEVGHYLGLYHTFQGGCTNLDCTQDGDQVCDTPPDNSTLATSCTNPPNTCTTDDDDLGPNNPFRPVTSGGLGDQPDQVINYMDYGSLSCLSAFTAGQKARMATYLVTTRASLLSSLGCTSPCVSPIVAGFTPSATQVQVGASVSFANASTGATVYAWERNGQVFSTAANPSLSFAAAGVHEITLTASNGDPSCTRSHRDTVYVECSENASFAATANNVAPGTLVSFTNTSTGIGTTFKWLLDGLPVSTATNWAYTFNTVGGYSVALVQYGANCNDTSLAWQVTVGACQSKRANNWYFGQRAAVEFSSGGPLPLFNASPFYVGFEACATISDTLGNLLFYTDGATVYNRNHVMMQNGDNLRANASNTQGALIIPKPGSAKDYYLFTQASPGVSPNFDNHLYVSTIDMSLANGLGAVVRKCDTLMQPTTEKLTATNHCNGRDVWVVNHAYNSNAFYAYLVTPQGIQPPVITPVGTTHGGNLGVMMGAMKISPDGKRLALVTYEPINGRCEIFDFDNSTGRPSNPILISDMRFSGTYSLEFSPNSKRLYFNNAGEGGHRSAELYQVDLDAGNPAAVIASMTLLSAPNLTWGGLQLAPDGKIYISRTYSSQFVSIDNPNSVGPACNVNLSGANIGYTARYGLPNFNNSFFTTTYPELAGPDTVCAFQQGVVFGRDPNSCSGGGSVSYSVSGNAQIIASTDTTVTLTFGGPGTVGLTMLETAPCGGGADQMTIVVVPSGPTVYLGPDQNLCPGTVLTLDAGAGYSSYLWFNGATTQTVTVSSPGTYWVEVAGGSACAPRDSITVTQSPNALTVNLGPDLTACEGQTVTFDAGPGYTSYTWQDGSALPTYTAWLPGNYWVSVTDGQCNGMASDTVALVSSGLLQVGLGNDTVLCAGGSFVLQAPVGFSGYLWQDGSTASNFTVTLPGTYWVQVTDAQGCLGMDTLVVSPCTGMSAGGAGMDLQVWPNPAAGELHFDIIGLPTGESVAVGLWDMAGRELLRLHGAGHPGTLDLRMLPKGLYCLRVTVGEVVFVEKVAVE